MDKRKGEVQTIVDARLHALYVGVTMSGKTTLARHHARILDKADYDIVVYDPVGTETLGGHWPEKAKVFTDASEFMKWTDRAKGDPERPIFVFVDESPDIFGHGHSENDYLPRRVRHQNIYLRLMSNRPKMLPPNVRTQFAHCYMFRLSKPDAVMLAADFGHGPEIFEKPLDTGDYLLLISGSQDIEEFNVYSQVD